MKKRCSKCQAILLENVKQCPICYQSAEENEAQYTLDDIQSVFVKRKNDKIFGPFPKAKIISLVSSGKLEASEFVSDDREKWIPVWGIQEFVPLLKNIPEGPLTKELEDLPAHKAADSLPVSDFPGFKVDAPGPMPDLPALKLQLSDENRDLPGLRASIPAPVALPAARTYDLPGQKTDLPGQKTDLPGMRTDLPGQKTDLPGARKDLPGQKTDLPGMRTDLPGARTDLPGARTDLPGMRTDLPGQKTDLPGARTDLPGARTDLPGARTDLPGARTDLPGARPDLPADPTSLPGEKTDFASILQREDENQDKNREFSLPPLGGGLIPEMKLDLNPGGMKSLEVHEIQHDGQTAKKIQIPPSLFESSDSVDLSVLGARNTPEKSKSGLDLDHQSLASASGVPASMELGNEETIPLTDEDPVPAATKTVRHRPSGKEPARKVWILIPLLLLLGVAAAFQLHLGPFSKKSASSKNASNQPQSPRPTAAVVSEHEKNLMNLDYAKLVESARGTAMIHCESALVLAWFYHEFEALDACKTFLQTPITSSGDQEMRRFQFFRALYLSQKPRPAQLERFYTGAPVPDPVKIMEEILSLSRSENNRASVWSFLTGVLLMEKKEDKKAREALQHVNSTETAPSFGVIWYLALLGDESAIKTLGETPAWGLWKALLPGFQYYAKHLSSFTFLAFPGEFPRIPVQDPAALERAGRRFRAVNYAFSSLAAWEGGQLDTANSLCDKAFAEDEQERLVWNVCSRMRLFHGQLGKFATTISLNQEAPTILAWMIEGRKNPALTAWEELKKQDPAGSLVLAPLVLLLSGAEGPDMEAALQAGMTADATMTLEYMWVGIWQRPDQAELVEKTVLAWKAEKKDQSTLVSDFLRILTLVKALHVQDWKAAIQAMDNWKIKGSAMLELEALVMMARMNDSKDNQAVIWADSQLQRVSPGARSAAALMNILGAAGKVQEAHQILDKYQEIFKEPLFYKAAAHLYVLGTRKDRLMRARFFADLALKANPQDAEALFIVGFIQLESGQAESGEKTIAQAVQSMSRPIQSWFMRWSELESRLKRPHMALAAMDAGLRKLPDHGPFLFRKAQILATQDNPKEALQLLEKTKDAGIEEVQRYILEGRCHVSLRQKREAEVSFSKAVKADSKNILARYLLGKTLLSNGSLRPAIPHLQYVAEELEKAATDQRIPEEATHWQTETLESMLAETCRLLGGAYKETGNRSMAIRYVKKYATLVPDGPMKDEALRLLLLLGGE